MGRLDRPLLLVTAALMVYGLLIVYSAGQTDIPTAAHHVWERQIIWLIMGCVAAALVMRLSPRFLEWIAPVCYVAGLAILLVLLAVGSGKGTAASSKSWLTIGGVTLGQPAELAKLTTVLMLARYLAGLRMPPQTMRQLIVPVLIAAVPAGLVMLQPDLGSAIVFAGILFFMLYWGGVPMRLLIMLASPLVSLIVAVTWWSWGIWIVVVGVLLILWRPFVWEGLAVMGGNLATGIIAKPLWDHLKTYQQNRLVSFLNPEVDPRATGWHIIQSKIAIGSGGLLGKGFTMGSQKRLAFLPAQHTDFIFSVVGEELGFVGITIALVLFLLLLMILIRVARRCPDPFGGLIAFGVAGIFFSHIFENVGMTANVMPITGIPLPFFSYGGSFLLTCLICVGLCLRVAKEGNELGYREI
ncbi:MAG TPA: rod shape-determining protein RodA [Gemmatimonadales bacterium]|jgi:rod shape determining protein RodA